MDDWLSSANRWQSGHWMNIYESEKLNKNNITTRNERGTTPELVKIQHSDMCFKIDYLAVIMLWAQRTNFYLISPLGWFTMTSSYALTARSTVWHWAPHQTKLLIARFWLANSRTLAMHTWNCTGGKLSTLPNLHKPSRTAGTSVLIIMSCVYFKKWFHDLWLHSSQYPNNSTFKIDVKLEDIQHTFLRCPEFHK